MRKKLQKSIKQNRPRVAITFRIGGENGGPYISHQRIMESTLKDKYEFIPLMLPKPKEILSWQGMKKLVIKLKEIDPDILHFTGLQLEGYAIMLAAKIAGVENTLCAIHGSSMDAIDFSGIKKTIVGHMENWTLRNAKACYGVSSFVCSWPRVKKYAKNNLGYVYNMRQKDNEQNIRELRIRKEFGITHEDIVIVSTGRIIKDKGFEILLKAIIFGENWENVKFLIVGEGAYLLEMKEQIEKMNLSTQVIFTGYRNDVIDILNESDIFVLCTLHETLCNSIIEASSASLPVVATRTGGIPEVVADGITGFLIEPYDYKGIVYALKHLIIDEKLRLSMGKAGRKRMENLFSEKEITDKLDTFYKNVMK